MSRLLCWCVLLLLSTAVGANNIAVQVTDIIDEMDNGTHATVTFDLTWENSWRVAAAPANWDAAWVFGKFRVNEGPWQHMTIEQADPAPGGVTQEFMDSRGMMIYRAGTGTGDVSYTDLSLRWDFAADGFSGNGDLDIQLYGLEMVYVPEGAFSLGTGPAQGAQVNETDEFYEGGGEKLPYRVTGDGIITMGDVVGSLYFDDTEDPDATVARRFADRTTSIPATYPEGFRAFYAMKYEMSQQQWVDFWNTLTPTQQAPRDVTPETTDEDLPGWRNGVRYTAPGSGVQTTTRATIPMGYLSQNDMLAYLDWAALRPMTSWNLKRRPADRERPVSNEYAWGTSTATIDTFFRSNRNTANETIDNPNLGGTTGNAALGNVDDGRTTTEGPLRCGIFAASDPSGNRVISGASYYGLMELSGNQWEFTIGMTDTTGRGFTNVHGDGALATNGEANVATWPTGRDGVAFKGGRTKNDKRFARTSDRTYTTLQFTRPQDRYRWLQARGVRGL